VPALTPEAIQQALASAPVPPTHGTDSKSAGPGMQSASLWADIGLPMTHANPDEPRPVTPPQPIGKPTSHRPRSEQRVAPRSRSRPQPASEPRRAAAMLPPPSNRLTAPTASSRARSTGKKTSREKASDDLIHPPGLASPPPQRKQGRRLKEVSMRAKAAGVSSQGSKHPQGSYAKSTREQAPAPVVRPFDFAHASGHDMLEEEKRLEEEINQLRMDTDSWQLSLTGATDEDLVEAERRILEAVDHRAASLMEGEDEPAGDRGHQETVEDDTFEEEDNAAPELGDAVEFELMSQLLEELSEKQRHLSQAMQAGEALESELQSVVDEISATQSHRDELERDASGIRASIRSMERSLAPGGTMIARIEAAKARRKDLEGLLETTRDEADATVKSCQDSVAARKTELAMTGLSLEKRLQGLEHHYERVMSRTERASEALQEAEGEMDKVTKLRETVDLFRTSLNACQAGQLKSMLEQMRVVGTKRLRLEAKSISDARARMREQREQLAQMARHQSIALEALQEVEDERTMLAVRLQALRSSLEASGRSVNLTAKGAGWLHDRCTKAADLVPVTEKEAAELLKQGGGMWNAKADGLVAQILEEYFASHPPTPAASPVAAVSPATSPSGEDSLIHRKLARRLQSRRDLQQGAASSTRSRSRGRTPRTDGRDALWDGVIQDAAASPPPPPPPMHSDPAASPGAAPPGEFSGSDLLDQVLLGATGSPAAARPPASPVPSGQPKILKSSLSFRQRRMMARRA
jgi:hypothetical protein